MKIICLNQVLYYIFQSEQAGRLMKQVADMVRYLHCFLYKIFTAVSVCEIDIISI